MLRADIRTGIGKYASNESSYMVKNVIKPYAKSEERIKKTRILGPP